MPLITAKIKGAGVVGVSLAVILSIAASLALPIAIIWGIVKLVSHFTGGAV